MSIPSIHVSDATSDNAPNPITTTYTNGTTTLSFSTTYPLLKNLLAHPPCPHNTNQQPPWPCLPCTTAFTTPFWTAAATLLDYLADFLHTDTPTMQSLWFHLVDVWHSAALWMDTDATFDDADAISRSLEGKAHVRRVLQFHSDYEATRKLFETVIYGARRLRDWGGVGVGVGVGDSRGSDRTRTHSVVLTEELIHGETTRVDHATGRHFDTGPWVSGLKPWAQYLAEGSPGAAGYPIPLPLPSSTTPSTPPTPTRSIPLPALALLTTHTRRAHALAATHFTRTHPASTASTLLATFTAHSLAFPHPNSTNSTTDNNNNTAHYTSLDGREKHYTLYNGAPPVGRWAGLGDEEAGVVGAPGWRLLDECVGVCKGVGGYVAVSGVFGDGYGGGGEEEEEEVEGDGEMEGWFDMWGVREGVAVVVGERSGVADDDGFWDMFDRWGVVE